jgi:glycosyltransferase involved in cell wall biosynthesis
MVSASETARNGLNTGLLRGKFGSGIPVDTVVAAGMAASFASAKTEARGGASRPKLLFLVTEDWYFCSHRLPAARAARDAGLAVAVACRVESHGEAILGEGLVLHPLAWRRRGDGIVGSFRALLAIARLLRAERPDLVHLVALKPVVFGSVATRLAFPFGIGAPQRIAAVMGLGSGFAEGRRPRWRRRAFAGALRLALRGSSAIVQNPDDAAALARLRVDPSRIWLIRGSGVDTAHFAPLPDPEGREITVALVARMLRSKGVLDAAAAIRMLRGEGLAIRLLLAGPPDPTNRDSLTAPELTALAAEPGVEWLGRLEDVRSVWRRAHIAVLPSTYGEGLPKALLEAAACGRPIVAADMPGTREIVRPGETGLLVPPGDVAALAGAIAALAADPARRSALGQAGRALVEREFAEPLVAEATLALYRTLLSERKVVG